MHWKTPCYGDNFQTELYIQCNVNQNPKALQKNVL